MANSASDMLVYVGCYTTPDRSGHGEGISAYRMDTESGAWQALGVVASVANPSFLAVPSKRDLLYSVHGGEMSDISGFAIDASGRLNQLGTWSSGGQNPVHLDFDRDARWVVIANYTGATLASLPIEADGTLGPLRDLVPIDGPPGPDPVQQAASHPHDIPFDPTRSFVAVPDKGLDRVFVFRFDSERGQFVPSNPPYVRAEPGAGPRHIAFHPRQRWAYVINELNSTITVYGFEHGGAGMAPLQTLASVPPDFTPRNTGSEILVHPSGKFVYVSNRGHDSVGIFEIDAADGSLRPLGWCPTQGKTPRAIALDPTGRFLYAANQASDSIVAFRVDDTRGLTPTGQVIATGSPSSIVFVAPPT